MDKPVQKIRDLCWTEHGFYFDVIWAVNNTWSIYFNHKPLKRGIASRREASRLLCNPEFRRENGIVPSKIKTIKKAMLSAHRKWKTT